MVAKYIFDSFNRVKQDTRKCEKITHTNARYFFVSRAWKNKTPQTVWSRMKHSVVMADVMKNKLESPRRPTVPGPAASAKTFTKEKQPLMKPNPKPDT